ncbi:8781_t:CDS:2, partial [Cetraspora pellucida]
DHDRRSCSNRFAYNPFNPFNPFASQNSMMFQDKNMMKVPWQTYRVIRARPAEARICSYCGAMGHKQRQCPIRAVGYPTLNVNNIKKSLKEYFKDPRNKSLRLCGCCGEIGHSGRNCQYRPINHCVPRYQYNLIKEKLKKFKEKYGLSVPKIPRRPRRPRIPNYIAACGCCGNENHNRNDPQCLFQNGAIQPCLNPRLIKSIRELRMYYAENNRSIPPNIRIGPQQPPNVPPPIPPRPQPLFLQRPNNNGNGNGEPNGIGLQPIRNLQNQLQQSLNIQEQNINKIGIGMNQGFNDLNKNINNGFARISNNVNDINQRFNTLDSNINNVFDKINTNIDSANQQINTNLGNINQRIKDFNQNNQRLNINLDNLSQRLITNNQDIGKSIIHFNELIDNINQNIRNININNTHLNTYMLTLENLQNQLAIRNNYNIEELFNNFRNDIRNMVFRQLNLNQRQLLQRIMRINQPKKMSITHRRTINFGISAIKDAPGEITNNIMDEMHIHSFSGSSLAAEV